MDGPFDYPRYAMIKPAPSRADCGIGAPRHGCVREGALPKLSHGLGPWNEMGPHFGAAKAAAITSGAIRGIIRIGTSAWLGCHAHIHIDLPSRRLRDLEPSSVPD